MTLSETMKTAWACLGGAKRWRGRVHGLLGLVSREFEISSVGVLDEGILQFSEHMVFSDGVETRRKWKITDTGKGLGLEAEDIRLLKAGTVEGNTLTYEYALKLGAFPCRYLDRFIARPEGRVENTGTAYFLGLAVLRVQAGAEPAPITENAAPVGTEPALEAQT